MLAGCGEGCRVAGQAWGQSQLEDGSLAHKEDRAEGRVVLYSRKCLTDCLYEGDIVLTMNLFEDKKDKLGCSVCDVLGGKRVTETAGGREGAGATSPVNLV